MKLHEIKQQQQNLAGLIKYCVDRNVDETWFNLFLLGNYDITSKKAELIDKLPNVKALSDFDTNLVEQIRKENREIEKFNTELIESAASFDGVEKEEKLAQKKNQLTWDEYTNTLPKEQIEKRNSLIEKFNKAMETDMEVDFMKLDEKKFADMKVENKDGQLVDIRFGMIQSIQLNFFFDENNWKSN